MDLSHAQSLAIDKNIKAAIKKIYSFQTPTGGFGYWPGSKTVSDWGTNYAGHFLIEAKNRAYVLPSGLIDKWIRYQQRTANAWQRPDSKVSAPDIIQAYRLYTLALAGKPAIGAMNRLRSYADLSTIARWRLASAYALIQQHDIARKLAFRQDTKVSDDHDAHYNTFGSKSRDQAMILEALVELDVNDDLKRQYIESISKQLNSSKWFSTQETAYMLLAISKYLSTSKRSTNFSFDLNIDDAKEVYMDQNTIFNQDFSMQTKKRCRLKNTGSSTIYVNLIRSGIPIETKENAVQNNLNMTIRYQDLNNRDLNIKQLKQGTDFKAIVTIKNPGLLGAYYHLALSQIFPGGWEIHNERLQAGYTVRSDIDYQDIRDDRVLTYFGLQPKEQKEFVVNLHAAYPGVYYLPACHVEAMYDHDIRALQPGTWVRVTPVTK